MKASNIVTTFRGLTFNIPSYRSVAQAPARASQSIPESNIVPKRARRTTITRPDTTPLLGT